MFHAARGTGVKLFRRDHAKKDAARRAVAVAREHAVIDHGLAGRERFEGGGAMDLVLRVHRRPALHEVGGLFGFDEAGVGQRGRRGNQDREGNRKLREWKSCFNKSECRFEPIKEFFGRSTRGMKKNIRAHWPAML